jgi:hypothetical protein
MRWRPSVQAVAVTQSIELVVWNLSGKVFGPHDTTPTFEQQPCKTNLRFAQQYRRKAAQQSTSVLRLMDKCNEQPPKGNMSVSLPMISLLVVVVALSQASAWTYDTDSLFTFYKFMNDFGRSYLTQEE